MYIFLIIWFVFLLAYIIFNIYGLHRITAMRFRGDAVSRMILIYLIAIFIVIFLSVLIISYLDWSKNLRELIRI